MAQFKINESVRSLLAGVISVTSASNPENVNNLRITTSIPAIDINKGTIKFEIFYVNSRAEFSISTHVEQEGTFILNSNFITRLPKIPETSDWNCTLTEKGLFKVINADFNYKYDFRVGDPSEFNYVDDYARTDLDVSTLFNSLSSLSTILSGFVIKKLNESVDGAIKISGLDNYIHIEATNNKDAIYGKVFVPYQIKEPWSIIVSMIQFEAWKYLKVNAPVHIGINGSQLTISSGNVKIAHNTLSNLMDSMVDIKMAASDYYEFQDYQKEDFKDMPVSFSFDPIKLNEKIEEASLFAEVDPIIYMETTENALIIKVKTATADSNIKVTECVKINKVGSVKINKQSFNLLSRLVKLDLSFDPNDVDTWPTLHTDASKIFIGIATNEWIGLTSQIKI